MAEMTSLSPAYEVSPVLAGFLGAGALAAAATAAAFLWVLCQRRPRLAFVHALKGVAIHPESPSHAHKVARRSSPWRRAHRHDPGCCPTATTPPPQPPPPRADYCCSAGEAPPPTPLLPDTPSLGSLDLGVEYSAERQALAVTIVGARGLPAVDARTGTSDPYVRMSVLPGAKHRARTRVVRRSLAPAFHETFTLYGMAPASLDGLTLHFLVLSADRLTRHARHALIGEALVPLAGVELADGCRVDISPRITRREPQCGTRGELLVSLSHHPATHRLNVVVLKAKHLPTMDITSLPGNPYVKVNVFYGRRRIAKRKTRVRRCTREPVFDESFAYDVPAELMADVSVEFLLIDFQRAAKDAPVGRLVLGGQSPLPSGVTHWREVCDNPRRQIAKWHDLSEF